MDQCVGPTAPALDREGSWESLVRVIGGGLLGRPLRIAVVAAHPDDEILGAGALLRRLSLQSARIEMIHVTDGAPRNGRDARAHGFASVDAYARGRRVELVRALAEAEVACGDCLMLGAADQAAVRAMVPLTQALATRLQAHPADVVLSHPFEGGHPDHDASAFIVHAAAARIGRDGSAPLVVEFTSYHLGREGTETGAFLPGSGPGAVVLRLSPAEQEVKRRARDCFESQSETLAGFGLTTEPFRLAPRYEFDRRPHAGRLLYEYFDWGLDGSEWERLAAAALAALDL